MAHYDSEKNRFNPDNRFIGDIEDGKRYPFACYTKEESDAKYAPISTSTDLTALTAVVATKAAQSDLTTLSGVVDTKASQSDLNTLSGVVDTKASQTDLTTLGETVSDLTTTVSGKASQSDLNALSDTVATKASSSDLSTLSATVNTLSTAVASKASNSDLAALARVVDTKASASALATTNSTVATKASQTAVDNLTTLVDGKASQASVDSLNGVIASKANSSDLFETNIAVATKAEKSAVDSSVANLQAQINNIVTPVTQDAEVENARVGADGTSYESLKVRIDTEVTELDTKITNVLDTTLETEKYIVDNFSKGSTARLSDNDYIFFYKAVIPKGSYIKSMVLNTYNDYNEYYSKVYILTMSGTTCTILENYAIPATGVVEINYFAEQDVYVGVCGNGSTQYSTDMSKMNDTTMYVSRTDLTNATQRNDIVLISKLKVQVPLSSDVYNKAEIDNTIDETTNIDVDFINNMGKTETGFNNDDDNIIYYANPVPAGKMISKIILKPSPTLNTTYSKVYLLTVSGSTVSIVKAIPITPPINTSGHTIDINYTTDTDTYVGICGRGSTKYSVDTTGTADHCKYVSRTTLTNPTDRNDIVLISDIKVRDKVVDNVYTKSEIDRLITPENIITVGTGKDYEKLALAVYIGVQTPNTTLIVYPQTYDFVEELATLDTQNTTGLSLYNNIHIKFLPGAKIVCNYTGPNTYINQNFSVFNANITKDDADFTLENVEIEASNIRYCIHDEMHNGADESYKHVYKGCKMSLDNSANPVWSATQCIGGGLGINGNIEIEDCLFSTESTDSSELVDVSYHNNDVTSCVSKVNLKNSKLSGTARFSYHGTSALKTRCIVSNCSLAEAPIKRAESVGSTVDNIDLIAYCNEIRS
ncbi:MAG: hypothetical protein J6Y01_01150 [Spirochaetales bacterium]|nr:hypothetical protein [Spirochaetales bacterium]